MTEPKEVSRPSAGKNAPKGLNALLEEVFNNCMKKQKLGKESCSKIAWNAAKGAGWSKDDKGKWHKKGADRDKY
jgi:cation transport regulator ChaB